MVVGGGGLKHLNRIGERSVITTKQKNAEHFTEVEPLLDLGGWIERI